MAFILAIQAEGRLRMAKTAKKRASSYELTCPHCGATVLAPCGSSFWTLEDMDNVTSRTQPCEECQQAVRIPKS